MFIAEFDVIMTSHFLAKVGASLQHAISRETRIWFLVSTGYLLVHRRGRIVYYVLEFKTI